jgi:hypothetical protein
MEPKTYKYWVFFIKPEYRARLGRVGSTFNDPLIYAYTDKKEYASGFLDIHSADAFILKKFYLTRDEVNDLAREFQNNIIRCVKLTTKDSEYCERNITIYMTESEHILSENLCYSVTETLWKYVWDPITKFDLKYQKALGILHYIRNQKMLNMGETYATPNMEADVYGAFIHIFKEVLGER